MKICFILLTYFINSNPHDLYVKNIDITELIDFAPRCNLANSERTLIEFDNRWMCVRESPREILDKIKDCK